MTRDAGREAAGIVRALRRRLERERAAGLGELTVRAARARPAPGAAASPAAPPVTEPASRAPMVAAPAPAPAAAAPPAARVALAPEVDLFGQPLPAPAPRYEVKDDGPRAAGRYNPGGWEARAAIAEAAAPLLEAIAAEVRGCRKCALWEGRTQAVPGVGTARSGIAFVGEAPGADEDRLGEPFVGRAGQLLDKIIEAMNREGLLPGVPLSRETVFIGNVIHCRPPENRVPLPVEVEMSSPYLIRQLEAIKPRILCCLGKTSGEFLLGAKGSLASMRGKVYRWRDAKLIVTYHPAACLRNPDYKRPVWEDMQFLAREYLADD